MVERQTLRHNITPLIRVIFHTNNVLVIGQKKYVNGQT